MKKILFFILVWSLSLSSQAEELKEFKELSSMKFPIEIEFKGKIPPNNFQREFFDRERDRFRNEVKKKSLSHDLFNLKLQRASRKINGIIKSLQEIDEAIQKNKSPILLDAYNKERALILKENKTTKKELYAQYEKIEQIKKWRDQEIRKFHANVGKAEETMQTSISLDVVAKLLKRSAHDFDDCQIEDISLDKSNNELKFTVKGKNDSVTYTLSQRLPIVMSPNTGGYTLQFKRDAIYNRGNASIADAKFNNEITELRMQIGIDGFPKDFFLNSLNMDRSLAAAKKSRDFTDILMGLLSGKPAERTNFHMGCYHRTEKAVERSRAISSQERKNEKDISPLEQSENDSSTSTKGKSK